MCLNLLNNACVYDGRLRPSLATLGQQQLERYRGFTVNLAQANVERIVRRNKRSEKPITRLEHRDARRRGTPYRIERTVHHSPVDSLNLSPSLQQGPLPHFQVHTLPRRSRPAACVLCSASLCFVAVSGSCRQKPREDYVRLMLHPLCAGSHGMAHRIWMYGCEGQTQPMLSRHR